jgi:DNA repair exonuclease SbcCD ATPase subunit
MTLSAGAQPSDHAVKSQSRRGSEVARKLKTIVDVANDFSTDSDIVVAVELIDQTFDLQNSLKQKSDRVEALENQIGELKARFENSSQDNLAIYEAAKKKLEVELESRENETLALKDDAHRKARDIEVLKDHETKLLFEAKRLQSASRVQTEHATANLTKIRDLEESLKTIRDECIAVQIQLRQEKDLHLQAQSRFYKLEKDYNSLLQEWQLAQSLTVELSNGDLEQL